MDCTFQNVCDDARGLLNDTDVTGGEIFTNTGLQTHRERAYRELFDVMAQVQTPRIERVIYWIVPANSTLVSPVGTIGMKDFSEPILLEERNSLTTVAISSTGTSSPIQVTTPTPHGLGNNQEVTIMGVQGTTAPWGRWFITVVDNFNFTLNSSITDGQAGTGGTVCWSNETFTDMDPLDRESDRQPSDKLLDYFWHEGVLRFRGATTTRQLRITYRASGNPTSQTNQPLGIDNALTFLGCRTASLAADGKGWYEKSDRLAKLALGPKMEPDGSGGFLRSFLNGQVIAMQRQQRQRQLFRPKRNSADWFLL